MPGQQLLHVRVARGTRERVLRETPASYPALQSTRGCGGVRGAIEQQTWRRSSRPPPVSPTKMSRGSSKAPASTSFQSNFELPTSTAADIHRIATGVPRWEHSDGIQSLFDALPSQIRAGIQHPTGTSHRGPSTPVTTPVPKMEDLTILHIETTRQTPHGVKNDQNRPPRFGIAALFPPSPTRHSSVGPF